MVNYCIKWRFFTVFLQNPYSVEPVLSGQPVFRGHPAIPREWPLNTGSTVDREMDTWMDRQIERNTSTKVDFCFFFP